MSSNYLILQILGEQDIKINGDTLKSQISAFNLKGIERKYQRLVQSTVSKKVEFPLLESLIKKYKQEEVHLILGTILTDQKKWAISQSKEWKDDSNWHMVAGDGSWGQIFLEKWLESEDNISLYPLLFEVDEKVTYGVADWEGMADQLEKFLARWISVSVENNIIEFQPFNRSSQSSLKIDKIVIQHSSGTPALSSALYLWGIERKMADYPVDFVYISEVEKEENELNLNPHDGKHWQWHLRLPIVKELIEIQDFRGALSLIEKAPNNSYFNYLKEHLIFLNQASSLDLGNRPLHNRERIIERISISLWSEKAFRERGQWLHWYLRIAGSFELAILLLVEKQSGGLYRWQDETLIWEQDSAKNIQISKISISDLVNQLLTNGQYPRKSLSITPINDPDWETFRKDFYTDKWKRLGLGNGFITIRNKLYHNLKGDVIETKLTEDPHAAQEVIDFLYYILSLAGYKEQIIQKLATYHQKVKEVYQQLP